MNYASDFRSLFSIIPRAEMKGGSPFEFDSLLSLFCTMPPTRWRNTTLNWRQCLDTLHSMWTGAVSNWTSSCTVLYVYSVGFSFYCVMYVCVYVCGCMYTFDVWFWCGSCNHNFRLPVVIWLKSLANYNLEYACMKTAWRSYKVAVSLGWSF